MALKIAITCDLHYGFDGKTDAKMHKFFKKLNMEIFDVLIIAGDMISDKQRQFQALFKLIRRYIPEKPILVVRGNHDFWDKENNPKLSFKKLIEDQQQYFYEYNIHHLEFGPFMIGDVIITGFDGWYHDTNPPTNDAYYMVLDINGVPIHKYLSKKADDDFINVMGMDVSNKKSICVTHFPSFSRDAYSKQLNANSKYMDHLTMKFDMLIIGHSHAECDIMYDRCQVINVGSDYNRPKYKILKV